MTRVVAVVLLAFVVFACGDPVNVEKRMPVAPKAPGLDLLGVGGLGGVINGELTDAVKQTVYTLVKTTRETLEGLNLCSNQKGGYKDGGSYGPYGPGYVHGNRPGYEPGYEPGYDHQSHDHGHGPNYEPDYVPDYVPSGEYKRNAKQTNLDFVCVIIKECIIFLRRVENAFKCSMGKEKGYAGDYQDCKDEYYKGYPQASGVAWEGHAHHKTGY